MKERVRARLTQNTFGSSGFRSRIMAAAFLGIAGVFPDPALLSLIDLDSCQVPFLYDFEYEFRYFVVDLREILVGFLLIEFRIPLTRCVQPDRRWIWKRRPRARRRVGRRHFLLISLGMNQRRVDR